MPKDLHARARAKDVAKRSARELAVTGKSSFEHISDEVIPIDKGGGFSHRGIHKLKRKVKKRRPKARIPQGASKCRVQRMPPGHILHGCIIRLQDFCSRIRSLPPETKSRECLIQSWEVSNAIATLRGAVAFSSRLQQQNKGVRQRVRSRRGKPGSRRVVIVPIAQAMNLEALCQRCESVLSSPSTNAEATQTGRQQ